MVASINLMTHIAKNYGHSYWADRVFCTNVQCTNVLILLLYFLQKENENRKDVNRKVQEDQVATRIVHPGW